MNRRERKEIVDKLAGEFDNIYYEVIDTEEISYYRKLLLSRKGILIYEKLDSEIKNFLEEDLITQDKIQKYIQYCKVIGIISLLLSLVSPYILVVLIFILFKMTNKIQKMSESLITKEENDDLKKTLKEMAIVTQNIDTFVTTKHRKYQQNDQKYYISETYYYDYNLINKMLLIILTSNMRMNVPIEVKNAMISILQSDLNTNIDDFEELIKMAREQLSQESIEKEMCLNRVKSESKGKNNGKRKR